MCTRCEIDKPRTNAYYHLRASGKPKLRAICKICASRASREWHRNRPSNQFNVQVVKETINHNRLPIVILQLKPKDSEYTKNIERTDTNPAFFNWLCSGSNLAYY